MGVINRYNPVANIVGGVVGFDPVNGSPLGLQERSQSVTGGLLGLYGTTQAGVALTNKAAGALVKAPPPAAPTLGAQATVAVAAAEVEATVPLLPESYWKNKKAPTQVTPGVRRVTDPKPSGRKKMKPTNEQPITMNMGVVQVGRTKLIMVNQIPIQTLITIVETQKLGKSAGRFPVFTLNINSYENK